MAQRLAPRLAAAGRYVAPPEGLWTTEVAEPHGRTRKLAARLAAWKEATSKLNASVPSPRHLDVVGDGARRSACSVDHAASKAGLAALTKAMAAELAPRVRVNAIAPATALWPDGAGPEKIRWAEEKSVLKRVGHPEDVARTVLCLADSDFATVAVYFVDGGRSLV